MRSNGLRDSSLGTSRIHNISARAPGTAGFVAAVGPNQQELGKICGRMTARILNGDKPAGMPIEHPVFELIVNLKSATTRCHRPEAVA